MRRADDSEPADAPSGVLLVGIDEAGYGPRLGPLVVAGSAFRVPAHIPAGARCTGPGGDLRLGELLAGAIAPPGVRPDGRLVVGDSKEVFGPAKDLRRLERPLLAFTALGGAPPADLDGLLAAVGADAPERGTVPWYAAPSPVLPLRATAADVAPDAARLRAALAASGVEFVGFAAEVLSESRLNAALAAGGNKADLLFTTSTGVLDRLIALRRPGEHVAAVLDRHGGRRFYLGPLTARWPSRFAWAVEETPRSSRYRLALGDADAELRFDVGADREAPQVGLASMLAKYLREAYMGLWNEYFAALCPGVEGTAGYAEDARRWLDESRERRVAAGVPDERIVRVR